MNNTELVKMENISVEFPGVKALDNVDFTLNKGEVHVLIGENGAGKSTLIKVLGGIYKTTSGKIYIENKEVHLHNAKQAKDTGINIIYQELNLVRSLSVAENVFLGNAPLTKGGFINWKKMYLETLNILGILKVNINPKTIVKNLGLAEQQMVEIARALTEDKKIIVMDEPTSALAEKEITELFRIINEIKSKGVGIIYISHRLGEIKFIGDRVTVLRDGKLVGSADLKHYSMDRLVNIDFP